MTTFTGTTSAAMASESNPSGTCWVLIACHAMTDLALPAEWRMSFPVFPYWGEASPRLTSYHHRGGLRRGRGPPPPVGVTHTHVSGRSKNTHAHPESSSSPRPNADAPGAGRAGAAADTDRPDAGGL